MYTADLINTEIPVLTMKDTVGEALSILEEFNVKTLPVVADEMYAGTLSEEILLNFNENKEIASIPTKNIEHTLASGMSIIQVVDFMLEKELEVVGVLDENDSYVGAIYAVEAFKELANLLYSGKGAVIELKLGQKDYSLTEISRLVENEGFHIQKLMVINSSAYTEDSEFSVFIKFNKDDASQAISSLKRFGYKIGNLSPDMEVNEVDRDRYELLMKYLNV